MNRFYLYKQGRLTGPHTEITLQHLRESGELGSFTWMIDEKEQLWKPIDPSPSQNPFQVNAVSSQKDTLSGAFVHRGFPIIGSITRIDAFGIELSIAPETSRTQIPTRDSLLQLNVVNEQSLHSGNYPVLFENLICSEDRLNLRFSWKNPTLTPTL